jgi:putative lipoprotein
MPYFLKHGLGLALALALSSGAHAAIDDCHTDHAGFRTTMSGNWFDTGGLESFGLSVPLGAAGTWFMRDTDHPVVYGTLIGSVPGFAKQVFDGTCRSDAFKYKEVVASAIGALTGAWLTHWAIDYSRDRRGTTVGLDYTKPF